MNISKCLVYAIRLRHDYRRSLSDIQGQIFKCDLKGLIAQNLRGERYVKYLYHKQK